MWRQLFALSCFQEDEKSSFPQHSTDMLVDWLNQRKVRSFYTSFTADSLKEGAHNLMQVRLSLASDLFLLLVLYTLKNKGASKGSSGDAIEEPFFDSTKNHSVKVSLKNHLFLTFL